MLFPGKVELNNVQLTDTALRALRAIAYQTEKQLQCLTQIASKQDAVEQVDLEYLCHSLDALPIRRSLDWKGINF